MRRLIPPLGLALAVFLAVLGTSRAEFSHAGRWKVFAIQDVNEAPLWIVELDKDGKKFEILDYNNKNLPGSKADGELSGDDKGVRFKIKVASSTLKITGYPAGKGTLLGSLSTGSQVFPVRFESTTEKTLGDKDEPKPLDGSEEFKKAVDGKESEKALTDLLNKYTGKPIATRIVRKRLDLQFKQPEPDAKALGGLLKDYVRESAVYGREMKMNALYLGARVLNEKGDPADALTLARDAAGLLNESDSLDWRSSVQRFLAESLKKNGKTDEANKLTAEVEKLDEQLDKEFEANAIPFKPAAPKKPKTPTERVAVVELFTGAQCPPCVAADIAFDAALKGYAAKEVVFLQYHLHIPGPDALTNADTEARQEYYGDAIRGTPTVFVDGVASDPLGGARDGGEESYKTLSDLIGEKLAKAPGASVKLSATRKGDTVDLAAAVSGVKEPGKKVRLRFVLVEDVARFAGRNGQRIHHHVVRAFPGGVEGFAVEKADSSHKTTFKVDEVRKTLEKYLTNHRAKSFWPAKLPLELKNLKVVALVQDDETKKVLQAAQVDLAD
jgi:hypothetical protein